MFVTPNVNQLYISSGIRKFMIGSDYNTATIKQVDSRFHSIIFSKEEKSNIKNYTRGFICLDSRNMKQQKHLLVRTKEANVFILIPIYGTNREETSEYLRNINLI